MKKITALLLAVMMVFAFAACGSSGEPEPEPQPEPETTTEAVNTNHQVSGLVEDLQNAQLTIFTEANQELTFNIENAQIETEDGIKAGDTATVEYTGKVSNGDTSGCEVTRVVDVAAAVTIIEGKVKSIDNDNSVTISSNGKDYSFKTKNTGSVKKGDTVKIKYAGVINGLDTSHVGIVFWQDGKLHLMHASSLYKKVVMDQKTFYDYSQGQKSHLGIRVYRPN